MHFLATDNEYIKERFHEFYNQKQKKKHYTVKLPCGHNHIEVEKPQDIYLECSVCHNKYLMTHSVRTNKLWTQ